MASPILITGASGRLGKLLTAQLQQQGLSFTSAGRSTDNGQVFLDLATGKGITEALSGKELVVHLASGTKKFDRNIDVEGTQRLLDAARSENIKHFIYISIVGIDRVPMPYYQYKLEAENRIKASGLPFTILRATQFHAFLDDMFRQYLNWPLVILPKKARFQPVDTAVVASELADLMRQEARQKTHELGGPRVLELHEIYTSWKQAQQRKARIIPLPAMGKILNSLEAGGLTCPDHRSDSLTWDDWLHQHYVR